MRLALISVCLYRQVAASASSCSCGAVSDTRSFSGIHINVLGNQFGKGGFQTKVDEWTALTGATATVDIFHPLKMEKAINDDKVNNTNHYDIYNMLNVFLPEFAENGFIMDISNKTRTSRTLRWPDVMGFVRESVCAYNGKVYGIPFDGDTFQLFFRRDVFANPRAFLPANVQLPLELLTTDDQLKVPANWHEYAKIAKLFRYVDLNGDGVADFGSCVPVTGFWNFYWIVAPMVSLFQHKSNSQGAFFDLPNTTLEEDRIEPLVDNEAFAYVIKFLYDLHYEGGLGDDNKTTTWSWGNMHSAFQEGRCLMYYSWPSVASNGVKKNSSGDYVYQRGRMGVAPLPGWDMYFDRTEGKLKNCTAEECPFSKGTNGYPAGVNAASFMANGGMTATVNAARPDMHKEAALDLLGYLSTGLDVALPGPYNAFRREQMDTDLFVSRSWEPMDASMFVSASKRTFNHPLQVLDLRVPNAHKLFDMYRKAYEDVLTHKVSIANAQLELKKSIKSKISKMDSQQSSLYFENIYRQNLGLPPRTLVQVVQDNYKETDTTPILVATGVSVLIGIPLILFFVRKALRSHFQQLLSAVLGEVATSVFNIITGLADTATDVIACIDVYEKGQEWRKYLAPYTCLVVFGSWVALGAIGVDMKTLKEVLCPRGRGSRRRCSRLDMLWHYAGSQRRRSIKRIAMTIAGLLQGVPMVCFIMLMSKLEGDIGLKLQVCLFTSCWSVGVKLAAGKEAFSSFKVGSELAYVAAQAEVDIPAESSLLDVTASSGSGIESTSVSLGASSCLSELKDSESSSVGSLDIRAEGSVPIAEYLEDPGSSSMLRKIAEEQSEVDEMDEPGVDETSQGIPEPCTPGEGHSSAILVETVTSISVSKYGQGTAEDLSPRIGEKSYTTV